MTTKRKKARTALVRRGPALPARVETPGVLGVFERLAMDRRLTVEKLATLVDLQDRIRRTNAEAAFDQAYRLMQPEIPIISRRGVIRNKQKQVQSHYSKYEDIRKIVDPILRKFGFHQHFATEWPETGVMEIVGKLTHEGGHTRSSRFRSRADASGGKNDIQGLGSATSYGRRYTTIDLLNIIQEGVDDDGKAAGETFPEGPIVGTNPKAAEPITKEQRQRLFTIAKRAGRSEQAIREWLLQRYKLSSTKDITRALYDEICKAVEAKGSLPSREPGED